MTDALDMGGFSVTNVAEPVSESDVVTRKYVDNATNASLTQHLKLDGSSPMTRALNMGGFSIANVAEPVSARDIVTKGYADNIVRSTHLNLRGNKIVNLREPTAQNNGVTKEYVDNALDSILIGNLNLELNVAAQKNNECYGSC